jgi:mono/diheme cytochrome c family protein
VAVYVGLGCGSRETPIPTGQVLYLQHCASCHGASGTGDGPVARSLRTKPADLTLIAARSEGRFEEGRVMQVIDGRAVVTGHGTREMPVWGVLFEQELEGEPNAAYTALLRTRALADYLRSIQAE